MTLWASRAGVSPQPGSSSVPLLRNRLIVSRPGFASPRIRIPFAPSKRSASPPLASQVSLRVCVWFLCCVLVEAASPPHLAARALCHPDALAPGPEGVSPLPSCELVEGTTMSSCFSACLRVSVTGQGVSNCPVIPVISHQCMTWDHSSVDLYSYSVPF